MNILTRYREHIIGFCFLLILFMPHTSTLLCLFQVLITIFIYSRSKDKVFFLASWIVIFCFTISFVLYIFSNNTINVKSIFGFLNLILLFAIFPIIDLKIGNRYFYIAISYVLLSQVCGVLNLSIIDDFFINLYPISEENISALYIQENATMEQISSFRLSGLWRSSNNSAREVCFIFAFFILNNIKIFSTKAIIFSLLCVTSILLTGSRTGLFIIFCLIAYYYSICEYKSRNVKKYCAIIIASVFVFTTVNNLNIDFRGFKLVEGFDNSANLKLETLQGYLQNAGYKEFLFGNFDNDLFVAQAGHIAILDSEYGYIIFQYGFVGLIAYIAFIVVCFVKSPKRYKGLYVVILWAISNSILCAFRSSLLLMLLLSSIISKSNSNLRNAEITSN